VPWTCASVDTASSHALVTPCHCPHRPCSSSQPQLPRQHKHAGAALCQQQYAGSTGPASGNTSQFASRTGGRAVLRHRWWCSNQHQACSTCTSSSSTTGRHYASPGRICSTCWCCWGSSCSHPRVEQGLCSRVSSWWDTPSCVAGNSPASPPWEQRNPPRAAGLQPAALAHDDRCTAAAAATAGHAAAGSTGATSAGTTTATAAVAGCGGAGPIPCSNAAATAGHAAGRAESRRRQKVVANGKRKKGRRGGAVQGDQGSCMCATPCECTACLSCVQEHLSA